MQATEQHGLITTLYAVFGKNIKIRVPFSKKSCDMSIDDICISPRANNSLKRSGIFTIGEIINLIENDELIKIRNGENIYVQRKSYGPLQQPQKRW